VKIKSHEKQLLGTFFSSLLAKQREMTKVSFAYKRISYFVFLANIFCLHVQFDKRFFLHL